MKREVSRVCLLQSQGSTPSGSLQIRFASNARVCTINFVLQVFDTITKGDNNECLLFITDAALCFIYSMTV